VKSWQRILKKYSVVAGISIETKQGLQNWRLLVAAATTMADKTGNGTICEYGSEEEIQADNDRFQPWTACMSEPSEEHKDNWTESGLGFRYHIHPVAA